jgi:hypothetical protein
MHRVKQINIYKIIIISCNTVLLWYKTTLLLIIICQIFSLMKDKINRIIQMMEAVCLLMRDIEIISFSPGHIILGLQVDIKSNLILFKTMIKRKMMRMRMRMSQNSTRQLQEIQSKILWKA